MIQPTRETVRHAVTSVLILQRVISLLYSISSFFSHHGLSIRTTGIVDTIDATALLLVQPFMMYWVSLATLLDFVRSNNTPVSTVRFSGSIVHHILHAAGFDSGSKMSKRISHRIGRLGLVTKNALDSSSE